MNTLIAISIPLVGFIAIPYLLKLITAAIVKSDNKEL